MQFKINQTDLAELIYHIIYEARLVMDRDEFAMGVPEIMAECSGLIAKNLIERGSVLDNVAEAIIVEDKEAGALEFFKKLNSKASSVE